MSRYYIDERVGKIAVRDRTKDPPLVCGIEYPGLSNTTPGVVRLWHGFARNGSWHLPRRYIRRAMRLLLQLQREEVTHR